MRYCDDMCLILNEITSSLKLMEELREDIMQEKQQRRRFYALGCGGQRCIRIPKHIVGHVMHVKEWADHRGGMSCP
jgi:hypothetical protein